MTEKKVKVCTGAKDGEPIYESGKWVDTLWDDSLMKPVAIVILDNGKVGTAFLNYLTVLP